MFPVSLRTLSRARAAWSAESALWAPCSWCLRPSSFFLTTEALPMPNTLSRGNAGILPVVLTAFQGFQGEQEQAAARAQLYAGRHD